MRISAILFAAAGLALTSACATRPPLPAETSQATFVLEEDLLGHSIARGEFRSIGASARGFTAILDGAWDGAIFTLREQFQFDDGARDEKTWRLTRVGPGLYEGVREDVIGVARGYQDGRALRLEYDVRLQKPDGSFGPKVRFRDVLVETAEGVVINRASVGYWGLRVGRVDLEIRRAPADASD
jgi:Protein of unknown function (DUF3833)